MPIANSEQAHHETTGESPLVINTCETTLGQAIDPSNELVRKTLAKLGPALVQPSAIFALMDTDPKEMKAVKQAICHCPTLTARVMGVINSAAFGICRQITSIDRAIQLLGPSRARSIALAYGLRILTERSNLPREIGDVIWANSIQKAIAAKKFCEATDSSLANEAYSLALVQDIGLPMLISADLPYFQNHISLFSSSVQWCEYEQERFGFDHTAVGQGLLREWHASQKLQDAVLNHHQPPSKELAMDSGIGDLALFLASLLPHLHEEPSSESLEWLQAIHARFLSHAYASPDQFLRSVSEETQSLCHQNKKVNSTESIIRKLTAQVTTTAITHAAKLCRLESDVSQTKQGLSNLKLQAFTDPLTKSLNRRGFAKLAQRRLELTAVEGSGVCCMLGDLDDFKKINDTHGHDIGDQLLKGLARVLRKKAGSKNLVGRLGGDEFAIFITGVDQARAYKAAHKIITAIEGKEVRLRDDIIITAHFSLGAIYAETNLDDMTVDQLLALADQAMYQRKNAGKHGMVFQTFPEESLSQKSPVNRPKSIIRNTPRES